MGSATKTWYDTDFAEWATHTPELVRDGRSQIKRMLLGGDL